MEEKARELEGRIRLLELRMDAVIELLTKEGVLTAEEVEQEIERLMQDDDT